MLSVLRVWGRVQRPWGYEVRVDYIDETGALSHDELTFPSAPDAPTEAAAVTVKLAAANARLAANVAERAPKVRVTCEDGTEVLL